jgi:hypothetical protein
VPLKIIKGDLLESSAQLIINWVNCDGFYLAVVEEKFPQACKSYLNKYNKKGWQPGDVQFVLITLNPIQWIVNCAAVGYISMEQCLEKVLDYADKDGLEVALSCFEDDKNVIVNILTKLLTKFDVDVTLYEYA